MENTRQVNSPAEALEHIKPMARTKELVELLQLLTYPMTIPDWGNR